MNLLRCIFIFQNYEIVLFVGYVCELRDISEGNLKALEIVVNCKPCAAHVHTKFSRIFKFPTEMSRSLQHNQKIIISVYNFGKIGKYFFSNLHVLRSKSSEFTLIRYCVGYSFTRTTGATSNSMFRHHRSFLPAWPPFGHTRYPTPC